jgi:hypothetical protein
MGLLGLVLAVQALGIDIHDTAFPTTENSANPSPTHENNPIGHRIYGVHGSPEADGEFCDRG